MFPLAWMLFIETRPTPAETMTVQRERGHLVRCYDMRAVDSYAGSWTSACKDPSLSPSPGFNTFFLSSILAAG